MAALDTALSLFSPHISPLPKPKSRHSHSLSFQLSHPNPNLYLNFSFCDRKFERFRNWSAVEEITVEETAEDETQKGNFRRKLFVLNLPWSLSVDDIKKVFGECGTVSDVEFIKEKDGRNKGFAFVTMASGVEAQAVIDKFDSHGRASLYTTYGSQICPLKTISLKTEGRLRTSDPPDPALKELLTLGRPYNCLVELSGRIIRVEFAKRFKKTKRPPAPGPPPGETRHKLYVSNLAWKARSSHLKEFFSANYNPVSARVVFDSPSGRSAGYGFVSFATKEEAESALSSLDGKEILGRAVRLKFSERNVEEASDVKEEETISEEPQST